MVDPKIYGVFLLLCSSFLFGWTANNWRMTAKIADIERNVAEAARNAQLNAQMRVDRINKLTDDLAKTIGEKQAAEAQLAEARSKTITEKVIEYAKSPNAGKCDLPNDWVRIHDAAARGMPVAEDANTTAGTNEAPSGIKDTDVLQVTTDNYSTCLAIATQLRNLQLWAKGLSNGTE